MGVTARRAASIRLGAISAHAMADDPKAKPLAHYFAVQKKTKTLPISAAIENNVLRKA